MSDNTSLTKEIFGEAPDSKQVLRNQVAVYMGQGAAYGALLFVGLVVFVFALKGIGMLLPPESKEAPDPSTGFLLNEQVEVVSHIA